MPAARLHHTGVLGRPQSFENRLHSRRDIGVVQDDSPLAAFPTIDVRNALVDRNFLAGQFHLAALEAGRISAQAHGQFDEEPAHAG